MNSNQKFIDFYSEYIRLVARTEYSECHFIEHLKRKKINRRVILLFSDHEIQRWKQFLTV